MRRGTMLVAATAATAIVCGTATTSARSAATLCVAAKAGCFPTIQAALDAAQNGDTIAIGSGTFAGGITILKSLQLVGSGAGATTIEGGGPVVTIGDGVVKPTVSISRVRITGGLNDATPDSFVTFGGGISILPAAGDTTGATVTISDSVISQNRVAPHSAVPLCGHLCAFAQGGGIANAGTLTVKNTTIHENVAGSTLTDPSVASYAAGGGILNAHQGTLTLIQSFVSGNRAAVSPPNGRNTDGGGIVNDGVITVEDSIINSNSSDVAASVSSSFPADVQQEANAGGIYLPPGSTTTITRSRISGNDVHSSNTLGDALAEAGGIDSDGSLILTNSTVDKNAAAGTVPASLGFLVETDGGGIQVQGVTTVRNSLVNSNSLSAVSETGTALASGGGIFNLSGSLTLDRSVVAANSADAAGAGGFNLGGGIANVLFGGGPPELKLTETVITANTLTASAGITSQGGGLYTADPFRGQAFPVAMTLTVIRGNRPDQCVGC
jgi:hypothetical protein